MIEQDILLSNPFPGLRPFETDENFLFFGRDGQSEEVLNRLRESRFVAVVGTSGSGKSSLVRAGLLPALYSGHMTSAGSSWRIALFRPGNNPIGNLAQALNAADVFGTATAEDAELRLANTETMLRRSSLGLIELVSQARMAPQENLLLLADQFEELFRFQQIAAGGSQEDDAAAFVKLLLESTRQRELPIYVILTMRSDYLGETARFWGLPEAINVGQYLIPRMTDDGRREAITGPLAIRDASVTVPLVNRLLNDAGDDPAQLPILQHALMRTWNYWKNNARDSEPLDIPHYEAVGGMAQALSLHADEAYAELSDPTKPNGGTLQSVAEKLFKCLTEKGTDNREVRRPATVREICEVAGASADEVETVIKSFRREGRSFLMPPPAVTLTPDTLIDISHESLIRGWQRLRDWANQEAQSARIYKRLAETAVLYEQGAAGLWRDPDLQLALKWREETKPNRVWAARYHTEFDKAMAFLDASLANREREAAEREQQIERELKQAQALTIEQQRRVRQQRVGLLVLSALLLLLMGLTAFAFQQRNSAQAQREIAAGARDRAEEELRKRVEADQHREVAEREKQIADEAKHEAEEQAAETLKGAAKRAEDDARKQQVIAAQARKAEAEAVKQRNIARGALDEVKKRRDEAYKLQIEAEIQRDAAKTALAAAEKERERATKEKERAEGLLETVKEIDRSAPYFKAIMRGHESEIGYAAHSPDGRNLVTIGKDGSRVWDAKTGELQFTYGTAKDSEGGGPSWVSFSPDGKHMVIHKPDGGGQVYDAKTRTPLFGLETEGLISVYSPDSRLIVSILDQDMSWDILDAQTGKKLAKLEERFFSSLSFPLPVFSPDGKFILTDHEGDAAAQIWDAATGKKVLALSGHTKRLNSVAFSHDGRRVVTTSEDGTARIWDASTGDTLITLIGHEKPVVSASFSSNDRYVVTASEDGTARVWDAVKGNTVVVGRGTRREHEEVQGITVTELKGHDGDVKQAIFSPDDKWVVTTGEDKTARVWQATKEERGIKPGETLAVLSGHIQPLTWVDFRADDEGKFVITTSEDRTARVWDLTGLNNLTVSAVTLGTEQPGYEGQCPATIKFDGNITAASGTGKLKYKFVYSDGRPSDVKELRFDRPVSKQVSTTLTLAASSPQAASEWVAIEILEPEKKVSQRALFTVKCLNEEQNQGAVVRVTEQVLEQIMPNLPADKRAQYLPHLKQAMAEFDINTPERQAAFLAQLAYESGEFRYLEELGTGEVYEGRKELGNTQQGDGKRFKGRGAIQIIGRANYQRFGQLLGLDLAENPELAATPQVAFRVAGVYWKTAGLNELADQQEFPLITKRLTGGFNGLAARQDYYDRARRVLGVMFLEPTKTK